MKRRAYLRVLAGLGMASTAGCSEAGSDGGETTSSSTEASPAGGPTDGSMEDAGITAPDTPMVDESIDLAATGLPSSERVWLEAETWDGLGRKWIGRAAFAATDGRVEPAAAAPVEGTYENTDRMGLFWSMRPEEDASVAVYDASHPTQSVTIRARRSADDPPLAETTVQRHVRHLDSEETNYYGDPLVGTLVESPSNGPSPGVVLLHGSVGARTVPQARVLASHGFTVLALQYFSPQHDSLPDALVEVPVEYAERAVEWLADHEAVSDAPIGIGGFSRGGELATLLGARLEASGTVINWNGAGITFPAFVWGERPPNTSAWTIDGKPLAHPDYTDYASESTLRETYEEWLAATPEETINRAETDVGTIEAPILLISAGDDGIWPSRYLLNRLEDRLDDLENDHGYEHRTYDGSGHGIGVPTLPTWANRPGSTMGGTRAATAAASADSWPRAIEFFERGADE